MSKTWLMGFVVTLVILFKMLLEFCWWVTCSTLFWIPTVFTYRELCYGNLRPKFILYNKGGTTCRLPLYDEWCNRREWWATYTAGYEGMWISLAPKPSEKVFKRHLFHNVLKVKRVSTSREAKGMSPTVFDTICANSSKLSFPSRSRSPSMIVLSTICCSCWSCFKKQDYKEFQSHWVNVFRPWDCCQPSSSVPETVLHWK